MLRKGVYSYEYVDSWQRFTEMLLSDKKEFYSKPALKDIMDFDYKHVKRVWYDFGMQNLLL